MERKIGGKKRNKQIILREDNDVKKNAKKDFECVVQYLLTY